MIVVAPLYNGLIGKEDMRFIFKTQATLAVTNVAASLLLIPLLGVLGAALGLLLATLYNASAIFKKGRHLTGNVRLTESVFRCLGARLPWACMLFTGAMYCGFNPDSTLLLGLFLLLVVLIVLAREPASVYLFAALKQKSFPDERI
jgi:O-antigen/teichoic acid export membrane protein